MTNERKEYCDDACHKLNQFILEREGVFIGEWHELANIDLIKKTIISFKESLEKYAKEGNQIKYSDKIGFYNHDAEDIFGKNLRPLLREIYKGPEYFNKSHLGFTHNEKTKEFYELIETLLNQGNALLRAAILWTCNEKSFAQAIGQTSIDLAKEIKWESDLYFGSELHHKEKDFSFYKERICKLLKSQDKIFNHQTKSSNYIFYYLNAGIERISNFFSISSHRSLVQAITSNTLPKLHETIEHFEYKNSGVQIWK